MNWPKMDIKDGTPRYQWPPFSTSDSVLWMTDLHRLKQAGFDTIRLTVGLGIFLSANETQQLQLDAILIDRVKTILGTGLNVIVDFHPITQDPRYPPIAFTRGPGEPLVEAFRALLVRTASNLSKLPQDNVVLEILNEPATLDWSKGEASLWYETQQSYFDSIRQAAPELTIIVTGCCTISGLELTTFDPSNLPDKNVYFTFHYYAPHAFTHQGVVERKNELSPINFFKNVPFPISNEKFNEISKQAYDAFEKVAFASNVIDRMKGKERLKTYLERLKEYSTPEDIDLGIQKTLDWAKRHGIPASQLFLGEFGVMRDVEPNSRREWLKTVVNAVERRGMAWGYWLLSSPVKGMELVIDPKTRLFDSITLDALGMDK